MTTPTLDGLTADPEFAPLRPAIAAVVRAAVAAELEAVAALADNLGATYDVTAADRRGRDVVEIRDFGDLVRARIPS